MGIKERREREKLRRRNDILDAAEKVFFEKGYNSAKMDDVAAEAELSKGTLYLHFKNKEELYFGLTHRALMNLKLRFQKVVEGKGTGIKKIEKIGRAYDTFAKEEPEYFKTIAFFEMTQLDANEEGARIAEKCHQVERDVLELVAAALIQGMEDGTIRDDIDPLRTAFMLQGLSNGIIQLITREGRHLEKYEMFNAKDIVEDLIKMIVRALHPD